MRQPASFQIAAASVLTVGVAFTSHEAAHALVGWLAGGHPTLLTATEVRGDFDELTRWGRAALGGAGTVANLLLAALGWWGYRRSRGARPRLVSWFFFALNGSLVGTKMIGEALAGWGDWMTILRPWPQVNALRWVIAILGLVWVALVVRKAGPALARLLPAGLPRERVAAARRLLAIGMLATAALVLGASVANPAGSARGMLLATGAALGSFAPLFFAARFAQTVPPDPEPETRGAGWPWLAAAGVVTLTLWLVVGPGIRF
ncbi:MAG: hypothetical protein AB7R55_06125 [Gemmatimonadales bacterium]